MDEKLLSIIRKLRGNLLDEPESIIYAEINEGNTKIITDNDYLKEYYDFLREADGARCGMFDLWSFGELSKHQFRISDFSGAEEKWIEIGQVLYEPVVINKESGQVYLFNQEEPDTEGRDLGSVSNFLANYVFGPQYGELVPNADSEEWYLFLKKNLPL
ncbi:hypothetical protein BBD42_14350 [Paenibacillus sp. BIHB 4019]|uniref:Knr4/Smi1-like domain-containing protein n=1 Tax=Paenibacillus sp. BIHB 4019 TaxID=1870819 RepID=A0A1B2DIK2_9BACL|nr:hypothetical protein [Paenibacillus sp. BIHB 4019]ANY67523.1 hypothetical protein BBD42_14350 [Paenibacillus sp. BIHB 4019]